MKSGAVYLENGCPRATRLLTSGELADSFAVCLRVTSLFDCTDRPKGQAERRATLRWQFVDATAFPCQTVLTLGSAVLRLIAARPRRIYGQDSIRPAARSVAMISERPNESSNVPVTRVTQTSVDGQGTKTAPNHESSEDAASHQATVIVRGETVRDQNADPSSKGSAATDQKNNNNKESPPKEVSEAKVKMRDRLPALDDDADIGVQKEQVVIRDGKPDLAFTGTLLASVAPPSTGQEHWDEYRIYETNGGKHVFSWVIRTVFAREQDHYNAEVFEPSPSSVPSQLLRSARDLIHTRPLAWTDAAVKFFGYGPLAKALYRKLGDQFEEHIN